MLNLILQADDIIKVGEMVLLTIVALGKIGSIRLRIWDMCSTYRLVSKGQKSYHQFPKSNL